MEPRQLRSALVRLTEFARRYERLFGRPESGRHARVYLRGLLSGADRKSVEPVALEEGVPVRTLQHFVGQARWRDERVVAEHQRHVSETLGRPDGVLVFDSSGFPKQGRHSVGVARQWCGNLGKEDNCQVGVFLGYASERGHTLLDRRLYLPRAWAQDYERRVECHIPDVVSFKPGWELAWEMFLEARRRGVPQGWVTGDEEFGKSYPLADQLHAYGQAYVFEVPTTHAVYDEPPRFRKAFRRRRGRPAGKPGVVGGRKPETAAKVIHGLGPKDWQCYRVRDGEKGPLEVEATRVQVWLSRDLMPSRPAWLVATRTRGLKPERKFFLAECSWRTSLEEILRAAFSRWSIEQCFLQGKQELGMDQYETRSWAGWHHHMTMVLLAHHFLVLERGKGGKKGRGVHRRGGRPGPTGAAGARAGSTRKALQTDSPSHPQAQTGPRVTLPTGSTSQTTSKASRMTAVSNVA
jgi:SRSO17 transposase